MELRIDAQRYERFADDNVTGIFIRAQDPTDNRWKSVDIVVLDKDSLLAWLRSRGGDNPWAEDVVGILLEHGHLHPLPEDGPAAANMGVMKDADSDAPSHEG